MTDEQIEDYLKKYNIPERRSLKPWIVALGVIAVGLAWVNFAPPQIAPWWDCTVGTYTRNMAARIRLLDSCLQADDLSDADRAAAHFKRANAYAITGRLEEALKDYDELIRLRRDYATAYYNRAGVYRELRDPKRAIADLGRAIRLRPTDAEAHYNRGLLFVAEDERYRAVQDFSAAIRLNPEHHKAWFSRAYVYGWDRNYQGSARDLTEAIAIAPDIAKYHFYRAYAYTQLEQYADAIRDANAAIDLSDAPAKAPNPDVLRRFYDGFNYRNEVQANRSQRQAQLATRPKSRVLLAYVYGKTLKSGPGAEVLKAQEFLKDGGYYDGPVDGIYRDDIDASLKLCAVTVECDLSVDPEDGLQ